MSNADTSATGRRTASRCDGRIECARSCASVISTPRMRSSAAASCSLSLRFAGWVVALAFVVVPGRRGMLRRRDPKHPAAR